jgi:hypothetical protein
LLSPWLHLLIVFINQLLFKNLTNTPLFLDRHFLIFHPPVGFAVDFS